jgi:hypothetical protein
MKTIRNQGLAALATLGLLAGHAALAAQAGNEGREVGGVTIYLRTSFDRGPEGWEETNGGQASLSDDAASGKALHVKCEKTWSGVRLPIAIRGSRDLKLALLMKGQNLPSAGVNIHDTASGDNTTPYGYRYLRAGGWTPILYHLDRCRYNSRTQGFVGPDTAYDELRFYGPQEAKPGMAFTLDELVIYRGIDRQAPQQVQGLKATSTAAGIKLTWESAADNVGVQAYVISRAIGDGAFCKLAESCATQYLDVNAVAGACRYRVFALDFEENFGPWSEVVAVQAASAGGPPSLTREMDDRRGYADRIRSVHARGTGRVRRGHATLFGDSLTGATVYPQCAESAFGTLSVNAFGFPAMRTDFGRQQVREILGQDNPEFMFVLYGTNNSKAERDLPRARDDLAAIVQACDEHGTVAVLGTIPPRGWSPDSQPEADYNARVIEHCRQRQIPTGYIFEGFQAAGDRRKYMGDDGVHWRGEGMEIAGRAWGQALDQIRFVLRDQE